MKSRFNTSNNTIQESSVCQIHIFYIVSCYVSFKNLKSRKLYLSILSLAESKSNPRILWNKIRRYLRPHGHSRWSDPASLQRAWWRAKLTRVSAVPSSACAVHRAPFTGAHDPVCYPERLRPARQFMVSCGVQPVVPRGASAKPPWGSHAFALITPPHTGAAVHSGS